MVTKRLDKASTKLFMDAVAGDLSATVKFKFTTTTKDKVDTFLAYELTNCGLSGYSMSSGGDAPTESLSLNFTKVMFTYTGRDSEDRRLAGYGWLRPVDDDQGLRPGPSMPARVRDTVPWPFQLWQSVLLAMPRQRSARRDPLDGRRPYTDAC